MDENSTKTDANNTALFAGEGWFDPAANASRFGEIEAGTRERVRGFIQELLEQELTAALDGTVVRVRLDRKATNILLLVVLGVRRDGQKVLLAVKNMGGEGEAAWRGILDGLIARGLSRKPEEFRRARRSS